MRLRAQNSQPPYFSKQNMAPAKGESGQLPSPRSVGILRRFAHELKERRRLPDEETHRRQEIDHAHRNPLCLRGTDDRAPRPLTAQERTRLRHNQVRLELLAAKRRIVQVWKGHRYFRNRIDYIRKLQSIAGLVRPGLKVHRLGGPDADQNSQHLHTGRSLRHRGIKAAAALFDGWEVKGCSICNSLKEVRVLGMGNLLLTLRRARLR